MAQDKIKILYKVDLDHSDKTVRPIIFVSKPMGFETIMNTIIACTDFSPTATHALNYAAALAQASHSRLILYHHYTYPLPATDLPLGFPAVFADDLSEALENRLKEVADALAKTYQLKTSVALRSWDLQLDLESLFQSEKASLVVMGMQGKNALINTLVGSISATAIRRGKLPLLLVPNGIAFRPLKKIIFPCDDVAMQDSSRLKPLIKLAILFDAYIEVFTLFDLKKTPQLVPQSNRSEAKNNLESLFAQTRHGYSYEHEAQVPQGILYEAERSAADLVAMIPHHHSLWSDLLHPGNTQRVAAAIPLPLMVLGDQPL